MANSSDKTTSPLGTLIDEHIISMGSFFELIYREIEANRNSDWENLVFLVDSAKARQSKFAKQTYEIYGDEEVDHG